jgi:hypothetical protein
MTLTQVCAEITRLRDQVISAEYADIMSREDKQVRDEARQQLNELYKVYGPIYGEENL